MWILETDGDIFQGKKLWLRPGKRFLFGRTRAGEGDFAVSDKTISRSHLLVEVGTVGAADCGNPRSRSTITITDQATKIGTTLNGQQIRSEKENKIGHVLNGDVNVIVLGKYPYEFRISWKPLTFTFSFTSKEHKADPYTSLYNRLGPLDIRVLVNYETAFTTHVAARKRNTAKGLQALVDGKYIVSHDTFVAAIEQVATAAAGPSLLETDFDKNFPAELNFLPPRGDEPTTRDASAYAPNPARNDMFEGYTFVFYERKQYDNLMAPITQGKGKALCHPAIPNKTEVEDFVRYVKGVAGEKGLGEFEDGSEGKGVVVVRFNPVKGEGTEWFKEFGRQVSIHLDQRFVEQNEFLDAILGVNASVLRRPLEESNTNGAANAPSIVPDTTSQGALPVSSVNQQTRPTFTTTGPPVDAALASPEPPPTRRGRRGAFKFRGFEDDDDNFSSSALNSIPASQSLGAIVSAAPDAESQGLFVSQNIETTPFHERERTLSPHPQVVVKPSRKRVAPTEDFFDSIAPAAAAAKRQKLAEQTTRRLRGEVTPAPTSAEAEAVKIEPKVEKESPSSKTKGRRKKYTKEDDIAIEAARLKAEEAAAEKRQALEVALDGLPLADMKNLAIIETMEVGRVRPGPEKVGRADESERWDEKWNGRKNFKKFRRRGGKEGQPRIRKVIVRLEEAKKRDFGIGDDYWLEDRDKSSTKESQKKKKKGKETQDDSTLEAQAGSGVSSGRNQRLADDGEAGEADQSIDVDASAASSHLPSKSSASSKNTPAQPVDIPSSSDVEVVTRPSRSTTRTQTQTQTQTQSQTLADKTDRSQNLSVTAGIKRVVAAVSGKAKAPPPAKKAKGIFGRLGRQGSEDEDEDSDDDGLAFKFRRKK